MVQKIILVFKTHFDIGFTNLAQEVVRQYAGPGPAPVFLAGAGRRSGSDHVQ